MSVAGGFTCEKNVGAHAGQAHPRAYGGSRAGKLSVTSRYDLCTLQTGESA